MAPQPLGHNVQSGLISGVDTWIEVTWSSGQKAGSVCTALQTSPKILALTSRNVLC